MHTSRLGQAGKLIVGLMAMCAASCMFVAVAQAAGPQWTIEEGGVKSTLASGTRSIANITNLSKFKLKTATATIVCNKVRLGTAGGTLAGGNPGADRAEIVFSECTVEGFPNCKAEEVVGGVGNGKIVTKVFTLLGFEKPKVASMALDAFFPEKANEEFATFTLVGEECPLGTNGTTITVKPKSGTTSVALRELGTRKCGVLAQVGKSSGSAFALISNNELFKKGGLNFPATAITEGEYWNGSAFVGLKCELEAGVLGRATEIGESELELAAPVTAYGWE